MLYSTHQECGVCKRVFVSPQHLISHINAFHSNRRVPPTFSSPAAAAPTNFRYHPNVNQNRNPNPGFQGRTHMDYYRRGYLDDEGKFHKGFPPAPAMSRSMTPPARKCKYLMPRTPKISKMPKLMDLFPEETSSECLRTLPLLCQLEQRRDQEDTVETESSGANSSSIDLSLRL
ncbi:hypothetical protein CARUB_v10011479mg [Capsella rubella]|uniref:C2H2-type domain-containing protein n=1 Tax=Capsella rubella TaxID=81985 RepID=R0GLU4_9BRAS|nr:uncharacterized protein LOC17900332 [Capsella rubella]EOA36912.1 hypothetical protein CARUB_v10011479mg [Capsella rubella]